MGRASLRAARCVRGPVLCYAVKGLPTPRSWWRMCCSAVERDLGSRLAAKSCRASDFQARFAAALELKTLFRSVFADSAASLFGPYGTSLCGQRPVLWKDPTYTVAQRSTFANLALSPAFAAYAALSVAGVLCRCPAGCGQRAGNRPPARVAPFGQPWVPAPLWAPCARRRGPRARRRPGPTRGPRRRRRAAPGRRHRRRRTTRRRSRPPSRRRRRRRRRRAGRRRRWPPRRGSRPWRRARRT